MSENVELISCPECKATLDITKYADHLKSDHKQYTVNIKGVGAQIQPPQPASPNPPVKFLDIPYFGRVRRDAFVVFTLVNWAIGILIAGWAWHII